MIALDVETTGVSPRKHGILSIGAVEIGNPENRFYAECRVWDGAHMSDEAFAINGFTRENAADPAKQSEKEAVEAFIRWAGDIRDWTIVGQNPSFDRDFLIEACDRADMQFPFAHRTIDTHSLAYMHMVKRGLTPRFDEKKKHTPLSLDGVLAYCGIPGEPKPHNALTGALCHAEVAYRLLYDRPLVKEFAGYPVSWKS